MSNDYSKLTNEDLISELNTSIKQTKLIFKEIMERQDAGTLKRKYDEIGREIFRTCNSKESHKNKKTA